jgi:HEAT repeat protein
MTLIKSLLIFYPLIMPVWEAGPFNSKNIQRAESLDFMNAPAVQFQINTFKKIKDPRIRGRIILDLINSNNPEAVTGMTFLYSVEKSDSVKADILTVLYKMKHIEKCGNTALLKACFDNDDTLIRGYGMAIYLDKTKDTKGVLELLKTEKSLFVKNLLWSDLIVFAKKCPQSLLKELMKSEDLFTRAGAARILAIQASAPDANIALKKASEDKQILVRAYLTEGLALRTSGAAQLLEQLSKDPKVQVRAFAASAKTAPDRMKMHITLATDTDPEIRRLAVVAFRHYREPVAIDALLAAMNDTYKPVRTAAEDSIIYMRLSPEVMERIGKEYLDQKPSVYPAVRVLGVLKDQRFNAEIEEILNSASDTDLMRRAINALGSLDYKKASASVAKKATCKDPLVREAVGNALGIFNIEDTFDTLVTLSADKKKHVSLAATKAMGIIKNPFFIDCLRGILKNVALPAGMRAYSCWSLARINQPSAALIRRLKKNALSKIIPIPMAGPDYDSDFARISACLALIELGKKDDDAKQTALKVIGVLKTPTEEQTLEFVSGETLQEYARQAELYMQGKEIKLVPLPTANPPLTVKKYVKK